MAGSRLYVGNLDYAVDDEQLKELFAKYGEVVKADIISGKGFGFVEMANSEMAEKAKTELNDTEFEGRKLRVDEARPPKKRSFDPPGGGYGSSRGGYNSRGRGSYGSGRKSGGGSRKGGQRRDRWTRDRGY
jgi:RNA recognition motif-containing protein